MTTLIFGTVLILIMAGAFIGLCLSITVVIDGVRIARRESAMRGIRSFWLIGAGALGAVVSVIAPFAILKALGFE